MEQPFGYYNAPRFVDFSNQDEQDNSDDDAFFDADIEETRTNSVRNRSRHVTRIESEETYYSPSSHYEETSVQVEEITETYYEKAAPRPRLRKSMSIGNLVMFGEQEDRDDPAVERISEDVQELQINQGSNTEQEEQLPKQAAAAGTSKQNNKGLNKNAYKGSMEHLNKLSQPRRRGSSSDLTQSRSNYVSLAEAVNQFQKKTPIRFRSKPQLAPQAPNQPQLFKIKAHPVNKKILQGPVKPIPVEKKTTTMAKPFNLTELPPKKVVPSPVKYVFRAKPIMRAVENPKEPSEEPRRGVTKPVTPKFMKDYRPPSFKVSSQIDQPSTSGTSKTSYAPRMTTVKPFSFEIRDKQVQSKREQFIKKFLEEERRAREFHAKPVPKHIYKKSEAARSDSACSFESSKKGSVMSSAENLTNQFKARPATVLLKDPFVPAKADKPLTEVQPFNLMSERRHEAHLANEARQKERELYYEAQKKLEEERQKREEMEEIARIRKGAEYKAQPVRKYKQLVIQPSGKVTHPITPKFLSRRGGNKENVQDDSL